MTGICTLQKSVQHVLWSRPHTRRDLRSICARLNFHDDYGCAIEFLQVQNQERTGFSCGLNLCFEQDINIGDPKVDTESMSEMHCKL